MRAARCYDHRGIPGPLMPVVSAQQSSLHAHHILRLFSAGSFSPFTVRSQLRQRRFDSGTRREPRARLQGLRARAFGGSFRSLLIGTVALHLRLLRCPFPTEFTCQSSSPQRH